MNVASGRCARCLRLGHIVGAAPFIELLPSAKEIHCKRKLFHLYSVLICVKPLLDNVVTYDLNSYFEALQSYNWVRKYMLYYFQYASYIFSHKHDASDILQLFGIICPQNELNPNMFHFIVVCASSHCAAAQDAEIHFISLVPGVTGCMFQFCMSLT